jgi:hypothetical protein
MVRPTCPAASAGSFWNRTAQMAHERMSGAGNGPDGDRAARLTAARDQLLQVLATLDEYSRSPAAATVDLAIHQINFELGV